ncbi:uncharacterized protein A4U43_C03F1460 [Asparagus officinalis]|uniref:DYW domain-containing protein n=1 Tax=Asparagus officinalis TaxID=4686 RepID=A0A5P1FBQ5_ASPOF|nr:pentatricopeptide repeat-containing protein At4g33170-like [Asparagus officinalis]ONK73970.1 uncharacterized protein A4U43_C03F1460 [Asparagus officinalis]
MYAKCNNVECARRIFAEMPERNLVSWSALIAGYDQSGRHAMAVDLFAQMKLQPNEYAYASVISSCGSLSALTQGKQVHASTLKTGHCGVSFVSNSLISMYMRCGCFDNAFSIFNNLPEPCSISYNTMITGFAENLQPGKGLELFKLMKREGLHADKFSYVAVLGICSKTEDLSTGEGLHCHTIKLGLDITAFVGNVILTMYSKCGLIMEIDKAFESIKEKDVITCNAYIAACSHCEEHAKGLRLYKEMEGLFGVDPDEFTLTSALAACAELSYIYYGAQVHARLIRAKDSFDVGVGNAIINMYAKCGSIRRAILVFHSLQDRNLVSWNTMIVALANHGLGRKAIDIFEKMKDNGVTPDSVTFIGLLKACSHAGLVDEGLACFNSMKETYGILPKIEHLSCLIDLLGRAGRLEEAEEYVNTSDFVNDLVIWGSLLSSCRIHRDVLVGERAARKLMELQPSSSSPYVLLSNLYASDGKWEAVAEARKLLKGSGVKKEPGHSLIAVKDIAEKFTVGDFSHTRIVEIIEALQGLNLIAEKFYLLPDLCRTI